MTHATLPGSTDAANAENRHDTRPVFGYIRVSTKEQEVARQRETIPARHASLSDGLNENQLEFFYDHGISAWSGSGKVRPDFEAMFQRIRAGEASALIVDTSSRLTRGGIKEALVQLQQLDNVATRLFDTQGQEYSFDLIGIITLCIAAESDERYSANLSHNTKTGKAALARAGKWANGPTPPGYRLDRETRELVATPDLPLITAMFDHFLAGWSYRQIGDFLTSEFSAEVLARTTHGEIRRDWVRLLLKTRTYLGVIPHGDGEYEAKHQAAVSREVFDLVQRKLQRQASENHRPARSWAFSKIARCGECDRAMTFKPSRERYAYVRCTNADCPRKDKGPIAGIFEATVLLHLAAVAQVVGDQLASDPQWAVAHADPEPARNEAREALTVAEARVDELVLLVKMAAIPASDPDLASAVRERDAASDELDRLAASTRDYRESLGALVTSVESLADLVPDNPWMERMRRDVPTVRLAATGRELLTEEKFNRIIEGWAEADFERRRSVIAEALEKVEVRKDDCTLVYQREIPIPAISCPNVAASRREAASLREGGWGVGPDATASRSSRDQANRSLGLLRRSLPDALSHAAAVIRSIDFAKAA